MQGLCGLLNALAKGPAVAAQLGVMGGWVRKFFERAELWGSRRGLSGWRRSGRRQGIKCGSWDRAGLVQERGWGARPSPVLGDAAWHINRDFPPLKLGRGARTGS